MNAHEREATERLEGWIFGSSNTPADADNIRTVLAAVRRHERLASEGLTEEELEDVEIFRNEMPAGKTIVGETVLHVIAKLQAQLAAAKEAITVAEGIASDALEDRGLPRIEEVRRETARECAQLAFHQGAINSAQAIRRRFGETILMSQVSDPNSFEPSVMPVVCQRCNGYGCISHMDGTGGTDDCPACSGTGRTPPDDDRRSIRRCLEDRP